MVDKLLLAPRTILAHGGLFFLATSFLSFFLSFLIY